MRETATRLDAWMRPRLSPLGTSCPLDQLSHAILRQASSPSSRFFENYLSICWFIQTVFVDWCFMLHVAACEAHCHHSSWDGLV